MQSTLLHGNRACLVKQLNHFPLKDLLLKVQVTLLYSLSQAQFTSPALQSTSASAASCPSTSPTKGQACFLMYRPHTYPFFTEATALTTITSPALSTHSPIGTKPQPFNTSHRVLAQCIGITTRLLFPALAFSRAHTTTSHCGCQPRRPSFLLPIPARRPALKQLLQQNVVNIRTVQTSYTHHLQH